MLSNPNNGMTGTQRETDLLDKLLIDKPPEVKARVLEVVYRLGISPHDELFLVMLALGYLQILIQDSPKEWEDLFFDFRNDLEDWSEATCQVLDQLILKANTEETLAKNSQQLVSVLTNLTTCCNLLMKEVQTSVSNSHTLFSPAINSSFQDEMRQKLSTLQTQNEKLSRLLIEERQNGSGKGQGRGLTFAVGAAGVVLLVVGWNLWGTVKDTQQRVHWILQKQIRAECLRGVKPKTHQDCKGI